MGHRRGHRTTGQDFGLLKMREGDIIPTAYSDQTIQIIDYQYITTSRVWNAAIRDHGYSFLDEYEQDLFQLCYLVAIYIHIYIYIATLTVHTTSHLSMPSPSIPPSHRQKSPNGKSICYKGMFVVRIRCMYVCSHRRVVNIIIMPPVPNMGIIRYGMPLNRSLTILK